VSVQGITRLGWQLPETSVCSFRIIDGISSQGRTPRRGPRMDRGDEGFVNIRYFGQFSLSLFSGVYSYY